MTRHAESAGSLTPTKKEHTMTAVPSIQSEVAQRQPRRIPLYLTIAAWAVPVMVIGQFAMLAILPLAVIVVGVIVDRRARGLLPWVGLLALAYATPLAIWLLRPDGAQSLSKDMHPAFIVLIAAVSVVVLAKIHWSRRRRAGTAAQGHTHDTMEP
jgi:hypothetical protein